MAGDGGDVGAANDQVVGRAAVEQLLDRQLAVVASSAHVRRDRPVPEAAARRGHLPVGCCQLALGDPHLPGQLVGLQLGPVELLGQDAHPLALRLQLLRDLRRFRLLVGDGVPEGGWPPGRAEQRGQQEGDQRHAQPPTT